MIDSCASFVVPWKKQTANSIEYMEMPILEVFTQSMEMSPCLPRQYRLEGDLPQSILCIKTMPFPPANGLSSAANTSSSTSFEHFILHHRRPLHLSAASTTSSPVIDHFIFHHHRPIQNLVDTKHSLSQTFGQPLEQYSQATIHSYLHLFHPQPETRRRRSWVCPVPRRWRRRGSRGI